MHWLRTATLHAVDIVSGRLVNILFQRVSHARDLGVLRVIWDVGVVRLLCSLSIAQRCLPDCLIIVLLLLLFTILIEGVQERTSLRALACPDLTRSLLLKLTEVTDMRFRGISLGCLLLSNGRLLLLNVKSLMLV